MQNCDTWGVAETRHNMYEFFMRRNCTFCFVYYKSQNLKMITVQIISHLNMSCYNMFNISPGNYF